MTIKIPKRWSDRAGGSIKRFQSVLEAAQKRDANESDTVTIVVDMLAEVFGFDKYAEITSEFSIRNTYCDLALRLDGAVKPSILIEVKAIGIATEDRHVKQAIDYAANQGVEWVILTTGITWILYRVSFGKPIGQEEVLSFNFLELDPRDDDDVGTVFALTKDAWGKCVPSQLHVERQTLNRHMLAALILSEPVLDTLRREIRKLADLKPDNDDLAELLEHEVLKRDALEGETAEACAKRVQRHVAKRRRVKAATPSPTIDLAAPLTVVAPAGSTTATAVQPVRPTG